ncbi:MAG: hypothetical protein ACXW4B_07550 [Micavibrio sp.]
MTGKPPEMIFQPPLIPMLAGPPTQVLSDFWMAACASLPSFLKMTISLAMLVPLVILYFPEYLLPILGDSVKYIPTGGIKLDVISTIC